jgi:hypothetical protein
MIMLDGRNNATMGANSSAPANETPAIQKKEAKQEEEISIEDVPF